VAPQNTAVNPTWTWGSSASVILKTLQNEAQSAQLAQVSLPEPAVCSIYFQATVTRVTNPDFISVGSLSLNLTQGLGRVAIPRQITFAGQPADGSTLEFTLPFLPVHSLQVDVSAVGNFDADIIGELEIQMFFVLSPLTRIPQKIQQLQFGMSEPGEADALDDELRENLEEESPTVQQIMGREAHVRVHGEDSEEDDAPEAAPAWMLDLIDRLTQRLRRAPTRQELRAAVVRYKARVSRRMR